MAIGRPAPRISGEWLVATMVYSSPREARAPGFDRWYWDVLGHLGRVKRVLVVAGAYDSDGTVRELLDEAKRRGLYAAVHFVEDGPLKTAYEKGFSSLAALVVDLDSFAERNGIALDSPGDISFNF